MNEDVKEAIREIAMKWMDTPEGEMFLYEMVQSAYDEGYENGLARAPEEYEDVSEG